MEHAGAASIPSGVLLALLGQLPSTRRGLLRCHNAMWRHVFSNRVRACLAFAACLAIAARAASLHANASEAPLLLAVAARGSIPGISDGNVPTFLANAMTAGTNGAWHFEPVAREAMALPNRIEWDITPLPSAAGSVRPYGFSRATMDRLSGRRQYFRIEATLYLNGQYQARSYSDLNLTEGADDADLSADVMKSTCQLMAVATARDTAAISPVGNLDAFLLTVPPWCRGE